MYDSILVPVIGAISLVLALLTVIYRLYAHPLAGFPGPKLAAATFLYEFYYDIIKGGMYIWEIERMHEIYGPIVRINPRELHIKDPSYYDIIHAGGSRKRAKDPRYAVAFGAPNSLVGTIHHDHHRLRRSYLSNYFSKRSIANLTPYIHQKVDQLIHRFENAYNHSTVLHLQLDFAALTADVITQYCYGWSYGYLDDPNSAQSNDLVDAVAGLMAMFHINRFFPFLITIFLAAPPAVVRLLQPQMASLFDVKARLRRQAEDVVKKKTAENSDSCVNDTIFDALVSPSVPPHEKSLDRLEDESALLLGAGTETTARAIAVSMFHLMNNQEMGLKLREELKTVLKSPQSKASWTDLEKLPYLTGAVNEGLRLSHGMTARLARISPTEPMVYKDWLIPRGTPISQSNYFVHMDANLFPEPEKFDPERWVRASEKGQHLSRFIVAFTKGSRQCLGINLAYSEIYITLAHIVRRFDFAPFETTAEDLAVYREQGVGLPKRGYFGVKAIVTSIVEE
ncbi:Putative Benzoate 4-monooxygenase cytochrome P450 [Penicillium brasilianum]|uniref:Putative Benzoate 4-monooxygenase cytochrome P450 n=1 Tax=Penicillium brasilianum TaxID=104259 RepID=A0A0F7TPY0_PENBI|nr:Putative Benzoate 4-monooxygenase cytochrome P450 [Penicillium brasilianum]